MVKFSLTPQPPEDGVSPPSEDEDNWIILEENPQAKTSEVGWKILVVDDDPDVHTVTRMVLGGLTFEGKTLTLLSANSSLQAQHLMKENSDIAVIFLDVVMETEDAGLKFVKYVRETLHNTWVRIILRTGQPGQFPEELMILNYDINDYKTKVELTHQKLITSTIAALRAYRDLQRKNHHKNPFETSNILVVDDCKTHLLLLSSILSHKGCQVCALTSSDQISKALQNQRPDLILLDVDLPELDGYTLCQSIKANPETQDIPIILMSASKKTQDKVKGFKAGGVDFISKPFQAEEVLARIETWLTNQQLKHQLEQQNQQLQKEIEIRSSIQERLHILERAIAASSNGIVVTEALFSDQAIIYANSGFERITGYKAAEVIGKNCRFLRENDDQQPGISLLRDALKQGKECQVVLRNYRKDGSLFWNELTISPVHDAQGNLTHFIGVQTDISHRLSVEDALRESELRFRNAFDSTAVGMCLVSPEGRFIQVNPAICKFLGYSPSELMQLTFEDVTHPHESELGLEQLQELIAEKISYFSLEKRYCRKDGKVVWGLLSVSLIRNAQHRPLYFIAHIQDITARKHVEEKLLASQTSLAEAQQIAHLGNWEFDVETGVITWSEEAFRIHGFEPHDSAPTYSQLLNIIHPDDRTMFNTIVTAALREGQPYEVEFRIYLPNGELRYLEGRGKVVRNAQQQVIRLFGTVWDITERKHTEAALLRAKEVAESANRAKSTFLANMSHELRSPLNAILGFTQLLNRDMTLTGEQRNSINIIQNSGKHLLGLINDILDISKIEAGQINLNEADFNLGEMLAEVKEMFQLRANEKGLKLEFEVEPAVPLGVKCDRLKLRQVLINLLSNAIKFTSTGEVSVQVQVAEPSNPPQPPLNKGRQAVEPSRVKNVQTLVFVVKDTGVGMASDELEHIFEPFVQTRSGVAAHEGTGLGLAISHKYIQLLGGNLNVISTLGIGSTFQFTVQVHRVEVSPSSVSQPHRLVIGLEPNQPRYRTLVVDDRSSNRNLLVQLLAGVGFEVQEATNGQEAIQMWQTFQPHLIWMDMRMPVLNGYEATQQIRALEQQNPTTKASVPIVALTASAFEDDRAAILAAGCNDIVSKPVQESLIFEKIAEYLGVRYLYAETLAEKPIPRICYEELHRLQIMPLSWLNTLEESVMALDEPMIRQLIQEIPPQEGVLIDTILMCLDDFEYQKLLDVIQFIRNSQTE